MIAASPSFIEAMAMLHKKRKEAAEAHSLRTPSGDIKPDKTMRATGAPDLRPHLRWALRRIETSLDTGEKYAAALAALEAAEAALDPGGCDA